MDSGLEGTVFGAQKTQKCSHGLENCMRCHPQYRAKIELEQKYRRERAEFLSAIRPPPPKGFLYRFLENSGTIAVSFFVVLCVLLIVGSR